MIDYRIISIGTLSTHPLWEETGGLRTPHATTTLVKADDKLILVDPALPEAALASRMNERTGLGLDAVTDVFLTTFRPAHRQGLIALRHANWWIHEPERESVGAHLVARYEQEEGEVRELIKQDIALLKNCRNAPDSLAKGVDLFPLPGYSPGLCGLLLALPDSTVVIASDAVATVEHFERGQILGNPWDVDAAKASLAEVIEIADWVIPGHDNITPNRTRRGF
ncbi:MAG: MBL fold metallo-hydrolase [Planctomycetota bacterium]|jgi:glyoxylase-like metal-dependent hydrolase (beta-lactamase superfamily II)